MNTQTNAPNTTDLTELAVVMARTLPQIGMDRMTVPQVEETLSCSALTAHY
ncbi:hypothetical protein SAMN05421803_11197 [Nocardiopsis flavescens]|uniref:Uncharacterized protein n=1 Tax=Nocardiopsis flavescens TaxID=758803 RepID=A0A1M6N7D8_9ACTN|nr:hypothetical protein [Nocardiopsis flavescens]SHJ91640.1 hypothetical protein SAMN05421803_11197 [Nocardiopsis flavescens]